MWIKPSGHQPPLPYFKRVLDVTMERGRVQEICGHIKPLRLNQNTIPGEINTLIDWEAIANFHKPANSTNYVFKAQLEYLQCDSYISSLTRIESKDLPVISNVRDNNWQKQDKLYEFKRKFNVKSGHTTELMLHTKWEDEDWGMPKAGEFFYNLGQYGYLNFLNPYLIKDAEILYSDTRFKVGVSIDGFLGDIDIAEITGGYTGTISYFETEPTSSLAESSGSVQVGTQATEILSQRSSRKMLFVSNEGETRLHFRFTNTRNAISSNAPFLEPGETLSINFDRTSWSGGNEHQWMAMATKYYIPLRLWGIRKTGSGQVFYQEFY